MYRRELEGRVLSFGHAGILYQSSFVMYDRQTKSLWVHVTGRAHAGPLTGKQLTFMPSTVTSWEQWKAAHPYTKVLPGHRRSGFMGTYTGLRRGSGIGVVVVVRFKGRLYRFRDLRAQPLVNDRFNKTDLLVYYSRKQGTATAWNRELDGRTLTFRVTGQRGARAKRLLRDDQTGSLWNWLTGTAESGPLKGKRLGQLLYNPILNDRFRAHYPKGSRWVR